MKKITIAFVLFLTVSLAFTSCENTKKGIEKDAKKVSKEVKKDAKEVGAAVDVGVEKTKDALAMNDYQCPMKCEGDKVYHKEGKCPKCNMALKKVDKSKDEMAMNDYQCPMKCEGDKVYHEEGKCPKCKMDLKKVEHKH